MAPWILDLKQNRSSLAWQLGYGLLALFECPEGQFHRCKWMVGPVTKGGGRIHWNRGPCPKGARGQQCQA